MRDASEISGYHAHIYTPPEARELAARLREEIPKRFTVQLGRWHEQPIGPHPMSMFQVAFAPDELPKILPWLMLNRGGLRVLVHPETGDDVADHTAHPLWLGEPLPLDIEFLRKHG
jgi:aromatic ring-cleaving dioxygenase